MKKFLGGIAALVFVSQNSLAHSGHGEVPHEEAPLQHFLLEPIHAPLLFGLLAGAAVLALAFLIFRKKEVQFQNRR